MGEGAYCQGPWFEGLCFGRDCGVWLINGIALLVAPHCIMSQVREVVRQSPALLRWEILAIIGGILLFFSAQEISYQTLWMVTAVGMIVKGAILSIGPDSWRRPVFAWCVGRERHRLPILGTWSLYPCGPVTPCARVDRVM